MANTLMNGLYNILLVPIYQLKVAVININTAEFTIDKIAIV